MSSLNNLARDCNRYGCTDLFFWKSNRSKNLSHSTALHTASPKLHHQWSPQDALPAQNPHATESLLSRIRLRLSEAKGSVISGSAALPPRRSAAAPRGSGCCRLIRGEAGSTLYYNPEEIRLN